MTTDWTIFLTLVALMVGTYSTRLLGFVFVQKINASARLDKYLHHVPGAVFMALIAPMLVSASMAERSAAIVAALVMIVSRSLPFSMAAAAGVAGGGRAIGVF